MIRVLVVDDQSLIRTAVRDLVALESDLEWVGEAANGREAVARARDLSPDVVLMDIRMPDMDGIEATRQLLAVPGLEATRVLILTTFEEEEYVAQALRAGASGFIGKGADPTELMHAVRTVHRGDALLSPLATRGLIDRYLSAPVVAPRSAEALAQLTERERELLRLVGLGRSNLDIAEELFLSVHTVKTHINRTMAKVGAHDRAQLVIVAYENGIVAPGA